MQKADDRAVAFERSAEDDTTAALKLLIAEALRRLAADYTSTVGSLANPVPPQATAAVKAAVQRAVVAVASGMLTEVPTIVGKLREIATAGLRLGARAHPQRGRRAQLRPSRDVQRAIRAVRDQIEADVAALRVYANALQPATWADVTTVAAKAQQAANHVAAATRWIANRSVNDGATAVADSDGAQRLWVAERDACLTCLAYSGQVADAGEPFPAGLTFGKTSTVTAPLAGPPAHPNCRCRVQPWYGQDEPFGVPLPVALAREAQRSVLTGASESESRPAKLGAADRLLKTGLSGLPETVKLRARQKVAAGVRGWRPARRRAST